MFFLQLKTNSNVIILRFSYSLQLEFLVWKEFNNASAVIGCIFFLNNFYFVALPRSAVKIHLNIKMLLILIAKIERWASLLEEMQNPIMNEINIFSSLKSFVRIDQWLFDIEESFRSINQEKEYCKLNQLQN